MLHQANEEGNYRQGDDRSIAPHDKTLGATAGSHWLRVTAPAQPIPRSLHFHGSRDKATGVRPVGKLIEVFSGQEAEQVARDRGNCHGNELGIDWVIDGAPISALSTQARTSQSELRVCDTDACTSL